MIDMTALANTLLLPALIGVYGIIAAVVTAYEVANHLIDRRGRKRGNLAGSQSRPPTATGLAH